MRAAVCREFAKPLSIENLTIADPGVGEIQVQIKACAICHSDIVYMDGGWGGNLPIVLGHEAAGKIIKIGDTVNDFQVGDSVLVTLIRSCGHCQCCEKGKPTLCESTFPLDLTSPLYDSDGNSIGHGLRTAAFAEKVTVDQSQIVKIPDDISMESACLLSCGVITGLGAVVNTASVSAGQSMAVIGCGGVGLNSIQGGVISGANQIIAIDMLAHKLEIAKTFGASHTVNASHQDAVDQVMSMTNSRGVEYAFMTAGSSKAIELAANILAPDGVLVLVGMPANGDYPQLDATSIAHYGQRILGSKMGSSRLRIDIPKLIQLYQSGKLKLDELVTNCYPLERINEAIDEVKADKTIRNVIVF